MAREEVVILNGARTPMTEWVGGRAGNGKQGGSLKDVSAIDLGAIAAKAALERSKVPPDILDHVIMGNALQTSGDERHTRATPPHLPRLIYFAYL